MKSLDNLPRESFRPLNNHNSSQKPTNPETLFSGGLSGQSLPKNIPQTPIAENESYEFNPETQKAREQPITEDEVSGFLGFLDKISGCKEQEDLAMPFPVDAMPSEAQAMIDAMVRNTAGKMDPALPAIAALSALSSAMIPRLECIIPVKGWKNGANLYTLAGANSSNGKSDSMDRLFAPIEKFQSEIQQHFKEVILPKLEVEEADLIDEEKAIRTEKKRKTKPGNFCPEEANNRLKEIKSRLREIKEEKNPPRFFLSDSSETAMVKGINRQKNKCLTMKDSDARKVIRTMLKGINQGGTPEEDKLIKAWDRASLQIDRSTGGPTNDGFEMQVHNPTMSASLMVQPDKVRELAASPEIFDSGLFQRFLMANLESPPLNESEVDFDFSAAQEKWASLIRNLLETFRYHKLDPSERLTVKLSDEANRLRKAFTKSVARYQSSLCSGVSSIAGKWAQNLVRIALILHGAKYRAESGNHQISAETFRAGIRIMEWFAAQQVAIFNPASYEREDKLKAKLINALKRYPEDRASVAQLKHNNGISKEEALRLSAAHPETFKMIEHKEGTNGRPTTTKIQLLKGLK